MKNAKVSKFQSIPRHVFKPRDCPVASLKKDSPRVYCIMVSSIVYN